MKSAVLITSAINTKFGVYSSDQRFEQTLNTISSVRSKIPDCKIFLLEMAAIPLSTDQRNSLSDVVDHVVEFCDDQNVIGLFNSTDNWDVVKNVTEVMCFSNALKTLSQMTEHFTDVQRIFKLSGRYVLTEQFDIQFYEKYKNQSMMVLGASRASQFNIATTNVERQYMSRLWSWPVQLTDEVIDAYDSSLNYMYDRLADGGYVDIEHCLYKFLDSEKIIDLQSIGVAGNIAPNGHPVQD